MTLNSERSNSLSLTSAGINNVCYHCLAKLNLISDIRTLRFWILILNLILVTLTHGYNWNYSLMEPPCSAWEIGFPSRAHLRLCTMGLYYGDFWFLCLSPFSSTDCHTVFYIKHHGRYRHKFKASWQSFKASTNVWAQDEFTIFIL